MIVVLLALGCRAVPKGLAIGGYSSGLALGAGYGGLGLGNGLGYSNGVVLGSGLGLTGGLGLGGLGLASGLGLGNGVVLGSGIGGGRVNAAILSTRSVGVIPVASNYGTSAPTVVDIDSSEQPVVLNFISRSSPLAVNQNHIGQAGSKQATASIDEAQILSHEVTRPVIQEVREVIVPSRNIVQEIRPVTENVQTLVARGEGRALGGGLALGGGNGLLLSNGAGLGSGLGLGRGLGLGAGIGGGYGSGYGLGLGGKGLRLSKGY